MAWRLWFLGTPALRARLPPGPHWAALVPHLRPLYACEEATDLAVIEPANEREMRYPLRHRALG